MKTKLATALSIVGVLGAGSAAALVNTQILDGSSESSASAAVLPPASTVELTVPGLTEDPLDVTDEVAAESDEPTSTTTEPSTTTTTSTTTTPTAAPEPTARAGTEFLTAFGVGDAGVVTVDVVNGRLVLVGADAGAGWARVDATEDGSDRVVVTFASSTVRVQFEAFFDGTKITPSVSSQVIPTASPAAPAPAPAAGGSTGGDGHGDDDHDDDDHHDDHDDDDDDHHDDHDDDHDDDDHHDDHDGDEDEEDGRDDD